MGQADAFETDFWKHANLRKVWDDIVPGEPRRRHHASGPRARQVHQARTAVRGARQRLLQPARRGDLLRPRLDDPATVMRKGSELMTTTFESLAAGDTIDGPKFAVSRESIRLFCDASLDYNPLHLDDDYMKGNFGKTNFGGVIMHGMNNFGLISRMITDWAYPAGAIHRRPETRWPKPVRPGDTIQPSGIVKSKQETVNSRWVLIDVVLRNQNDEKDATGEAMVEFPHG